jgi:hypothetical protein
MHCGPSYIYLAMLPSGYCMLPLQEREEILDCLHDLFVRDPAISEIKSLETSRKVDKQSSIDFSLESSL